MENTIILTRMYVGKYLEENIGHEVINLFKADNGDNYIYVNEDGRINPKYNDSVRAVLLLKYVEKGVMEVMAKAEHLEQIMYKTGDDEEESRNQVEYIDSNNITYGGVPLYKVYNDTIPEKRSITFKTRNIRLSKKPIYLIEDRDKEYSYPKECIVRLPEKHFSSQSLKMYYTKSEFPKDYRALEGLLNNVSLWEKRNTTEKIDIDSAGKYSNRTSFLSIIRKEYDELAYSNMFAYYFEQNRDLFVRFAKDVLKISGLSREFSIIRESNNHVDLWIEDDKNVIIIENKIKSKINGERHDIYSGQVQSQLKNYYDSAVEMCPDKNVYCYIFAPNYNFIDLSKYEAGEQYEIINYSQIYDFYKNNAGEMIHINYFKEYLDALEIHSKTVDNSNFEIMRERFITRIRGIVGR